jgi:hypothetical protein
LFRATTYIKYALICSAELCGSHLAIWHIVTADRAVCLHFICPTIACRVVLHEH